VQRPEGRLTSESDAHGVLGTLVSPFAKVAVVGSREKGVCDVVTFARLSARLRSVTARNGKSGRTER
jgi:hypothetical protein